MYIHMYIYIYTHIERDIYIYVWFNYKSISRNYESYFMISFFI